MTDRDRLIKLFNSIDVMKIPTDNFREHLADYLIENGVIVMPCKVGDIAYTICCHGINKFSIRESIVNKIEIDEFLGFSYTEKIKGNKGIYCCYIMNPNDFGESIFFNKEEAEVALKER